MFLIGGIVVEGSLQFYFCTGNLYADEIVNWTDDVCLNFQVKGHEFDVRIFLKVELA